MSSLPISVRVGGLDKTFRLPEHRVHTLKERALHPFRQTTFDKFQVLKGISFEVLQGEFFGIVGRNGSGKSTLLKCMAGIYRADRGTIEVAGRLSPFIELGVGFNPDLTARDNVLINAVMMGLTPKQARARLDDVIAFAELERFVDQKLKNYSSGMQVRLAFSVMVQSDPDVMLIDEVLAVGDAAFQQKCIDVFYRLRGEGKTIVLVTHEMGLVERFCHRAMMLSGGDITHIGDPAEIGRAYMSENFADYGADRHQVPRTTDVVLADSSVTDTQGERVDAIGYGDWMALHVSVEAIEEIRNPGVTIWLTNEDGVRVFAAGARENGEGLGDMSPGERVQFTVALQNRLSAGRYFVGCSVTRGTAGLDILLFQNRVADVVSYGKNLYGLVGLDFDPTVIRSRTGGADQVTTAEISTEQPSAATGEPLELRRIGGPSALGGGRRRFFHLLWMVASSDFKLTYFGSVLGYLWSFMQPLLFFGVLYLVFGILLKFNTVPDFPVLLLMNIVLFNFFQTATGASVASVVVRENMVRKMHFPRLVIPLAVVCTAAFQLALNLIVVMVFMLIYGLSPRPTWLLMPVIAGTFFVLTAGVAMLLSSLYVRYRDVAPIWSVIGQALFYASPVFITVEAIEKHGIWVTRIYMFNPLAAILEQARYWIIGNGPSTPQVMGGYGWALIPLGILIAIVAIGFLKFRSEAPRIAEEL